MKLYKRWVKREKQVRMSEKQSSVALICMYTEVSIHAA